MKDWREDNEALRNYLREVKGFSENDIHTVASERIADSYQNEMVRHNKQQAKKLQQQQAIQAKQKYAEQVESITKDDKLSHSAKIEALLTIDD